MNNEILTVLEHAVKCKQNECVFGGKCKYM